MFTIWPNNVDSTSLRRDNVAVLAEKREIRISNIGQGGSMPAYTDENWDILAEIIRTTASVERLVFPRGTAIALQNDKVVDAIAKNRTIKILSLWAAFAGDEGAKAVAAILKENSMIEMIGLYQYNISCEGAKAIAEALKDNPCLQSMDLEGNQIGVEGAEAIAEALKGNTSLQKLYIRWNNICDEGAKAIADALKENHSLQKLSIEQNNIGDQGARAIAEALKDNHSLQDLFIRQNNIGEKGGKHILNALQQIERSAIENIGLWGNQISEETFAKIDKEMIRIRNRSKGVGANEGQVAVTTTEDGGIQGDENASLSNKDEWLTTIDATNASQDDGSAEGDRESNEARHDTMAMETKIKELQSTVARQQAELAQKDGDIAQLHSELALKQEEIASLRIQRLNGLDVGSGDLENYTKCCVCLEPYEEDPNTGGSQRLPIKSATCAHSLCEGCLDDYHASLMNGRSTVRYVRCPQCNDKTKNAFDIQNRVVDFFLREYIQCRKRKRLT